jgi:glycosyltransferase involved in cell wall biosynthesis
MFTKRILLISEMPPPPGGLGLQARTFLHRLEGDGCLVGSVRTNFEFDGIFRFIGGIKFLRGIVRSLVFNARAIRSAHKADILHVFSGSYGNYFLYTAPSLLIGRLFGKKVILHYHGGGARDFFSRYGLFARGFLKLADHILVPSRFLQEVFEEIRVKTLLVPNILDIDRFPYRERTFFRPRFVVTRHLEPLYDVGCAIRAFTVVKTEYPAAHLTVSGEGSQRAFLEKLAEDLGVKESVTFTGNVPNEDIYALYDDSDIFLNSSLVDNSPLSILEAFASGLPVVTSNAGGISYIVQDGENGMVFPPGDHGAMTDKILMLLANPETGRRLARRAHTEVEKHRWENVKGDLFDIYECADSEKGR